MRHLIASFLTAAVVFVATSVCMPADSFAAEADYKSMSEEARRNTQSATGTAASRDQSAVKLATVEEKLDSQHRGWALEFKRRSFEWHLLSTMIIFGLVIFIVGFGLVITYMQFRRDYTDSSYQQTQHQVVEVKPAEGGPAPVAVAVPSKSVTSMKLGPGGLELSSQIIGLAVLAFSLGFFYLYVKNVYPMLEVDAQKVMVQPKSGDSK